MVSAAIFFQEGFRKDLLRMVVRNDLPYAIVESVDLRRTMKRLKSNAAVPSADTLKRDIMACYNEEFVRVRDWLRNTSGKISLTLDCWTSTNNTKVFMGSPLTTLTTIGSCS